MVRHTPWEEVPLERLSPTISRRVLSGEKVMAAIVTLKKGAVVPAHHHESEQITYILEGGLRFTLGDGSTVDVRAGETLLIPSNVEHAAVALEDTLDLDCFSPIREDWLSGDDAYLRGEG
ncbi:MAG: cupin domain-containing protein [Acidobacteriota bacterium]